MNEGTSFLFKLNLIYTFINEIIWESRNDTNLMVLTAFCSGAKLKVE